MSTLSLLSTFAMSLFTARQEDKKAKSVIEMTTIFSIVSWLDVEVELWIPHSKYLP